MDIFKEIKNYSNYRISSNGDVISLPKKTRKLVHISWNNYFSETNFKIRSH